MLKQDQNEKESVVLNLQDEILAMKGEIDKLYQAHEVIEKIQNVLFVKRTVVPSLVMIQITSYEIHLF